MGSSVCETFIGEASRILSLRHDSLICVIDSDLTAQIPWYAVLCLHKEHCETCYKFII